LPITLELKTKTKKKSTKKSVEKAVTGDSEEKDLSGVRREL